MCEVRRGMRASAIASGDVLSVRCLNKLWGNTRMNSEAKPNAQRSALAFIEEGESRLLRSLQEFRATCDPQPIPLQCVQTVLA